MSKVVYKDEDCIISEFTEDDEDQELVKIVKERLKDSDKNIKIEIKPS